MDFTLLDGQNLLVLQDGHSKWPEVKILAHTDASPIIEMLQTLFAAYGLPEAVVSEMGHFAFEQLANFFSGMQLSTPSHQPITPRIMVQLKELFIQSRRVFCSNC
jgi:hypothetical protein